jgi:hypothetical protein
VFGWNDVEQLPLADRAARLLELLLDRLSRARLLQPARSLTVGELAGAARFADPADRGRLVAVARSAEDVRYAPMPPDASTIEHAIAQGRELLDRLDAGVLGASAPGERAGARGDAA